MHDATCFKICRAGDQAYCYVYSEVAAVVEARQSITCFSRINGKGYLKKYISMIIRINHLCIFV